MATSTGKIVLTNRRPLSRYHSGSGLNLKTRVAAHANRNGRNERTWAGVRVSWRAIIPAAHRQRRPCNDELIRLSGALLLPRLPFPRPFRLNRNYISIRRNLFGARSLHHSPRLFATHRRAARY